MDIEPAICAVTKAESIENTDVIKMRNINKSYRMGTQSLHVLKDVSLTVKQGEYLAILGPSGSGKSTLMNIIGCMDGAVQDAEGICTVCGKSPRVHRFYEAGRGGVADD